MWSKGSNPDIDEQAVEQLLQMLAEEDIQFALKSRKRKSDSVYKKLANRLVDSGFNLGDNPVKKVRDKWGNLKRTHKDHCDSVKQTGAPYIEKPKYYDQIDAIRGSSHSINPKVILDSKTSIDIAKAKALLSRRGKKTPDLVTSPLSQEREISGINQGIGSTSSSSTVIIDLESSIPMDVDAPSTSRGPSISGPAQTIEPSPTSVPSRIVEARSSTPTPSTPRMLPKRSNTSRKESISLADIEARNAERHKETMEYKEKILLSNNNLTNEITRSNQKREEQMAILISYFKNDKEKNSKKRKRKRDSSDDSTQS